MKINAEYVACVTLLIAAITLITRSRISNQNFLTFFNYPIMTHPAKDIRRIPFTIWWCGCSLEQHPFKS